MRPERLQSFADRLRAAGEDPELPRLAPGLSLVLELTSGAEFACFTLDQGRLRNGAAPGLPVLRLDLPEPVLAGMAEVPPAPRHQGFTALQLANPNVRCEGDPVLLAQARAALERLFERALAMPPLTAPPRERDSGALRGRIVTLHTDAGPCELFTETAGSGVPLVFLHTAGADSRQFQAQLADSALGDCYEMHAPDMPFHGRSLPPLSWNGAPYQLSSADYLAWVTAYLEQVVQRPAILAGCSMGAAITLEVAAKRPDLLRAALAIEPPFQAQGRLNRGQNDVAVHAGLHNGAFVRGLMAPGSPESRRRRAAWIYSQGAPGVYQGDLTYYSLGFDGAEIAPQIDATRLPVVLLSGRYDYSATPEDGAKLAALMPGARQIVMPELGHFPMTEHPDLFAIYLTEALTGL